MLPGILLARKQARTPRTARAVAEVTELGWRMELGLTGEQKQLRSAVAEYMRDRCPIPVVRELADAPEGMPARYMTDTAELGTFSLLLEEPGLGSGVSGEGVRDLAIVAEEHGRGLGPGPFVAMNVVVAALSAHGSELQRAEVLPELVAGRSIGTWAAAGADIAWQEGARIEFVAESHDGFRLSGFGGLVQDATAADWLLVSAGEVNPAQFLVPTSLPGVHVRPVANLDVTQRFGVVELHDAQVRRTGLVGRPGPETVAQAERQLQLAVVLTVAETVGAMTRLFEITCQYARDRIAFGRPIGSFQAIKHQLADLSLKLETSKAVSVVATRAVQAAGADAGEIASMAAAWVGSSGIDLAQGCLQIFGGIGYTWEHDLHLFLRRITMNAFRFGAPAWHLERLCRMKGI
jgi:alkylation response protein AidB-like acyl-CoA dehydrogenase